MGKSWYYWGGCYWTLCMYHYKCMYGTLTHWIKIDLCIRIRKTGDCIAVTTLKESKDLPCDPWVQEVKHVYLFFLLVAFSKNPTFLLLVAGTWGQEEARRGKKNGFNYRKKGPVRTGCYISQDNTTNFHGICFLIFFFFFKFLFITSKNLLV